MYGARIGYLILATAQNTMLGAVLGLSERVFYPSYAAAPRLLADWSPLDDQAFGGGVMWSGSHMFLLAVLVLLHRAMDSRGAKGGCTGPPHRVGFAQSMLDIGIQELLVIMVLALLIFGPDKLPDLGRRLGRAMREFRRASDEFRSTVEQNLQINADQDISPPTPSPLEPQTSAGGQRGAGERLRADGAGAGTPSQDGAASGSRGARGSRRTTTSWSPTGPVGEGGSSIAGTAPGAAGSPRPSESRSRRPGEGWDQGLQPCPACDPKEVAVAS